jgi:hypothetical protein
MVNTPNSPFQTVVGLGTVKSEHPAKGSRWTPLIVGVAGLVAAPLLLFLALFLGYTAYSRYGLMRVDDAVWVPLIGACLALVIGILAVFNAWRIWPLAAVLYEEGFAVNRRQGLQTVRWNQISWVKQAVTKHYYNGIYTGTTHLYTIETRDNLRVKLDDQFTKVEDLGRAIQQGTTNALFPQYVQALQSGQRLTFGPLSLDAQKLYSGAKEMPWSEIKAISLNKGTISVKKDKGWFNWATVTVPQIPNFFIFIEIASRLTKVE